MSQKIRTPCVTLIQDVYGSVYQLCHVSCLIVFLFAVVFPVASVFHFLFYFVVLILYTSSCFTHPVCFPSTDSWLRPPVSHLCGWSPCALLSSDGGEVDQTLEVHNRNIFLLFSMFFRTRQTVARFSRHVWSHGFKRLSPDDVTPVVEVGEL